MNGNIWRVPGHSDMPMPRQMFGGGIKFTQGLKLKHNHLQSESLPKPKPVIGQQTSLNNCSYISAIRGPLG